MRSSAANGAGRIGNLIVHSWPVQAAGLALITVLVTWAVTLFLNRKRVAWRAYLDTPINLAPTQLRYTGKRLTFKIYVDDTEDGHEVDVPWLVLLRIRNAGFVPVRGKDFNTPLTFTFAGREVRGAEVIEHSGDSPEKILAQLPKPAPQWHAQRQPQRRQRLAQRMLALVSAGAPDTRVDATAIQTLGLGSQIQLSKEFLLNRKDRFTLMVVLSGTPEKGADSIKPQGSLDGGKVVDESPRHGPSTRSLMFGAVAALPLAGLLVGLFLNPNTGTTTSPPCPKGSLLLEGSTAFAPAAMQIASQFEQSCHGASITVGASNAVTGSVSGLNALISTGDQRPAAAASQIAMSDGPAPTGGVYSRLVGTPIGVIIFTVVVNRQTHVYNLTSTQVQEIFSGTIANWRQLGGPDLPVSIVSRIPGSGTRRAFDQFVLGGTAEPAVSSYDCTDKNAIPTSPVILCDEPSTPQLLQSVAQVPGAIGYAETSDVAAYSGGGIQPVQLDGIGDTFGNIGSRSGTYQFWTVEYLYTYGTPAPASLAAEFLAYVNTATAKDALREQGYMPCTDQHQDLMSTLCAPGAR